ncbi:Spectrin alpha chain, non-erythrocytic 1-like 1, partial [Homarus americanus]
NDKHEDLTEGKDGNTSKAGDEVEDKSDPIPPTKTVITLLIALRYFKSRTPNEVTVLKGDKMLLLNRKSKDWWFVEVIRTKNQGYIPRSIVARLPTAGVLAAKKPATLVQVHDGKPANLDKTKNEDEADDESKNDSGTENEINNEDETENEINNEDETENEINNEDKAENEINNE